MRRLAVEFGPDGVRRAVSRGDAVCVIVDVFSFCTAVATAVANGGAVVPCGFDETPPEGLPVASPRGSPGRFSLSPSTFADVEPGETVVLPSPNGSAASRMAAGAPHVLAGAIVNATAVGERARALGGSVTVVACGEEGRFALEDHLGAAAVAAVIHGERLPGAAWFREALAACESARELVERGFPEDVEHGALLDRYDCVPELRGGAYRATLPAS